MKILIEIFWQKLIVSNVISTFLDHLKHKIFFAGQPWWLTWSAPLFKKSGSIHDNIFVQYNIVISDTLVGSFLDVLFLLLAVILSELHEKQRRKDWVTQKVTCVKGITFLNARLPFYVIFFCFLLLLPAGVKVTYLLNGPYKDT